MLVKCPICRKEMDYPCAVCVHCGYDVLLNGVNKSDLPKGYVINGLYDNDKEDK